MTQAQKKLDLSKVEDCLFFLTNEVHSRGANNDGTKTYHDNADLCNKNISAAFKQLSEAKSENELLKKELEVLKKKKRNGNSNTK